MSEQSSVDGMQITSRKDSRRAPLGVFDSGLGGLTVVRALRARCPGEDIIYLGDTARVPYGTRSAQTVIRYARGSARALTERGVKALIVACNTVSAVAVEILQQELSIPVVGVVEPGAEAAVQAALGEVEQGASQLPKIGVLGTPGTILSGAYPRAVRALAEQLEVVGQAAPLLVPLVEEGWLTGQVPELAVERYIGPLLEQGVGVLVLGCTHYPLLRPIVEKVAARLAGHAVPVVDSAEATSLRVARLLEERRIVPERRGETGQLELLVTDLPGGFQQVADLFLGEHTPQVEQMDLTIG